MLKAWLFVAIYAFIACGVGWFYFMRQQWPEFFERHGIDDAAREPLVLHLTIGAAAVGAAWPVAVVFAIYGVYMNFVGRVTGRAAERANI